jgi:hypothetical protein
MNLNAVMFGFFVLLAASLNFGFFIGDLADPTVHSIYSLFAAAVVSLIATAVKVRDRTHAGAVHLATSLAADLELVAAALVWTYAVHISHQGYTPTVSMIVVSLSGGALLANLVSVILLVAENVSVLQRHPGSSAERSRGTNGHTRRTAG